MQFPQNSRYHGIATQEFTTATGKTVVYVQRRFIPSADQYQVITEHEVIQGDRLDLIADRYLGDPEQFWQICDANNTMIPDELTAKTGTRLKITLPAGLQGVPYG